MSGSQLDGVHEIVIQASGGHAFITWESASHLATSAGGLVFTMRRKAAWSLSCGSCLALGEFHGALSNVRCPFLGGEPMGKFSLCAGMESWNSAFGRIGVCCGSVACAWPTA
jgi:hypothetical protein